MNGDTPAPREPVCLRCAQWTAAPEHIWCAECLAWLRAVYDTALRAESHQQTQRGTTDDAPTVTLEPDE